MRGSPSFPASALVFVNGTLRKARVAEFKVPFLPPSLPSSGFQYAHIRDERRKGEGWGSDAFGGKEGDRVGTRSLERSSDGGGNRPLSFASHQRPGTGHGPQKKA